ncbi:unnamed protein product [Arctogadus glacialis]
MVDVPVSAQTPSSTPFSEVRAWPRAQTLGQSSGSRWPESLQMGSEERSVQNLQSHMCPLASRLPSQSRPTCFHSAAAADTTPRITQILTNRPSLTKMVQASVFPLTLEHGGVPRPAPENPTFTETAWNIKAPPSSQPDVPPVIFKLTPLAP